MPSLKSLTVKRLSNPDLESKNLLTLKSQLAVKPHINYWPIFAQALATISMITITMKLHCCLHAGYWWKDSNTEQMYTFTTTPQPFYGTFLGPPRWAGARRELLDFMVQGKINRGRHTDHPAGRCSIRTNQYPPPPSPIIFTGRMPFLRPNQQCQSTESKQMYTFSGLEI